MPRKTDPRDNYLSRISEMKRTLQDSMAVPAPAPYIVAAAAKAGFTRKRKLTQADIGLMEAEKFSGYGRFNDF